jgi:hypothetical protein
MFCSTKQMGWMAKSKVVLNYKLELTNKELDGRLTCPGSVLLQCTHACFVAS